jgi:cell division protein FtsZ
VAPLEPHFKAPPAVAPAAAAEVVASAADDSANIIFGSVVDESLGDSVRITVIATGFDKGRRSNRITNLERPRREAESAPRRVESDDIEIPEFLRGND